MTGSRLMSHNVCNLSTIIVIVATLALTHVATDSGEGGYLQRNEEGRFLAGHKITLTQIGDDVKAKVSIRSTSTDPEASVSNERWLDRFLPTREGGILGEYFGKIQSVSTLQVSDENEHEEFLGQFQGIFDDFIDGLFDGKLSNGGSSDISFISEIFDNGLFDGLLRDHFANLDRKGALSEKFTGILYKIFPHWKRNEDKSTTSTTTQTTTTTSASTTTTSTSTSTTTTSTQTTTTSTSTQTTQAPTSTSTGAAEEELSGMGAPSDDENNNFMNSTAFYIIIGCTSFLITFVTAMVIFRICIKPQNHKSIKSPHFNEGIPTIGAQVGGYVKPTTASPYPLKLNAKPFVIPNISAAQLNNTTVGKGAYGGALQASSNAAASNVKGNEKAVAIGSGAQTNTGDDTVQIFYNIPHPTAPPIRYIRKM